MQRAACRVRMFAPHGHVPIFPSCLSFVTSDCELRRSRGGTIHQIKQKVSPALNLRLQRLVLPLKCGTGVASHPVLVIGVVMCQAAECKEKTGPGWCCQDLARRLQNLLQPLDREVFSEGEDGFEGRRARFRQRRLPAGVRRRQPSARVGEPVAQGLSLAIWASSLARSRARPTPVRKIRAMSAESK